MLKAENFRDFAFSNKFIKDIISFIQRALADSV